jgi:outer membrane protein assembly factor BamE (lipoprotein component of BamABCDE complex)
VVENLGPSATGSIVGDSGIYYVRSRVRSFGMFEPEVVEREVVAVSFNASGVVSNVERFGLERGQVVPLSRRVTEANVDNRGFLQQLLGNVGRIGPGG